MKDRRGHFRAGLHPLYLPLYDQLCGVLPAEWQPICGLRTFEEQERLYAKGRTEPGPEVTKAAPGLSFHNYGLATDWDYFPNDVYSPLSFSDSRWADYEQACQSVGLNTISWEKPHNEVVLKQSKIRDLLDAYNQGGMDAANLLLKKEE